MVMSNCEKSLVWWTQKRKKIKYISEEEKGQIESEEQVENDIYLKEKRLQLYQRMQQLNEQTREVIYLRITGELSFKEIGQMPHISISVSSRLTFWAAHPVGNEITFWCGYGCGATQSQQRTL